MQEEKEWWNLVGFVFLTSLFDRIWNAMLMSFQRNFTTIVYQLLSLELILNGARAHAFSICYFARLYSTDFKIRLTKYFGLGFWLCGGWCPCTQRCTTFIRRKTSFSFAISFPFLRLLLCGLLLLLTLCVHSFHRFSFVASFFSLSLHSRNGCVCHLWQCVCSSALSPFKYTIRQQTHGEVFGLLKWLLLYIVLSS